MAASVTYTFVPGSDAEATQINQNFADLVGFLNGLDIAQVPVPVAQGGTGATTAASALTNLGAAPLASPTFTGTPDAPTPPTADDSTRIATTAYVQNNLSASGFLLAANNLSDVPNPAVALANLNGIAFGQFTINRVLAAQGNQRILLDGMIMKWGTGTAPNTGGNTSSLAVSFPVSFANACYGVVVVPRGGANSGSGVQPTSGTRSESAAGFTALFDTLNVAVFDQTLPFYWFAWGS